MPAPPPAREREVSLAAIVLGVVLSMALGAANVYLGLKAGMTVAASIPAVVVGLAVLRGLLRRRGMLEANLVQTAASSGEAVAAGVIFTLPALVIIGYWQDFDYLTTTLVALAGGLLGTLLMIPMRQVFIVESPELQYPEAVACAEVLRAGGGAVDEPATRGDAGRIVQGLAVGTGFKFLSSFAGLIQEKVQAAAAFYQGRIGYVGLEVSPALVGVGLIVGLPIAVQVFFGGAIGTLVALPLLTEGASGAPLQAAADVLKGSVRYIGVGTMIVAGCVSIWRVRGGLTAAVKQLLGQRREHAEVADERSRNLSGVTIFAVSAVSLAAIAAVSYERLGQSLGLAAIATLACLVMGFFFTAVASYIVGLVGNSNSPVSGMTISTVLVTGGLIFLAGFRGEAAMVATLIVAGVVCCVASTAGDTCNDLKTGHLIGASPRRQQWFEILGVVSGALVLAPVMSVLHQGALKSRGSSFGGDALPAPQAKLFASLVQGMFGADSLPWNLVGYGVAIGLVLVAADALLAWWGAKFRLHVMPVAVGIYLPFTTVAAILAGGLLAWAIQRRARNPAAVEKSGVLLASGLIAGESLLGVLLGYLAYRDVQPWEWGRVFGASGLTAFSLAAFVAVCGWLAWQAGKVDRAR